MRNSIFNTPRPKNIFINVCLVIKNDKNVRRIINYTFINRLTLFNSDLTFILSSYQTDFENLGVILKLMIWFTCEG